MAANDLRAQMHCSMAQALEGGTDNEHELGDVFELLVVDVRE